MSTPPEFLSDEARRQIRQQQEAQGESESDTQDTDETTSPTPDDSPTSPIEFGVADPDDVPEPGAGSTDSTGNGDGSAGRSPKEGQSKTSPTPIGTPPDPDSGPVPDDVVSDPARRQIEQQRAQGESETSTESTQDTTQDRMEEVEKAQIDQQEPTQITDSSATDQKDEERGSTGQDTGADADAIGGVDSGATGTSGASPSLEQSTSSATQEQIEAKKDQTSISEGEAEGLAQERESKSTEEESPSGGPPVFDQSGDIENLEDESTSSQSQTPGPTTAPEDTDVTQSQTGGEPARTDSGNDVVDAGADVVSDVVDAAPDAIGEGYDATTDVVGEGYGTVSDAIQDSQLAQATGTSIDALAKIEEQAGEPITGAPGDVESTLGSGVQGVESTFEQAADFTKENVVPGVAENLPGGEQLSGIYEQGLDALTESTIGAPAEIVRAGETATEAGEFTAKQIEEEGVTEGLGEAGSAAATTVGQAGSQVTQAAKQDPVGFGAQLLGGAAGGLLTGTAASRAIGTGVRKGVDIKRTAGGEKIDVEDLTNKETVDSFEGKTNDPDARFPGANDPDLYKSDPEQAVRRQADEMTPKQIEEQFQKAGVEEGTTLKKGIETDPKGPGTRGFQTQEGGYESPGAFVGPELSPNFLGISGESSYSLKPGLPDFGNKPTGVLAKTDVEAPEADGLTGLREEIIERSGETTAVTKPAGQVNTGEIEAIIPPGAQFTNIGDSGVLRRVGIGSDYYTEVSGRRVPLRLVKPEGDADIDASDADIDSGQTLAEIAERPRSAQDSPLPTSPGFGSSQSGASLSPETAVSDMGLSQTSQPPTESSDSGAGETGPTIPSSEPTTSPSPPMSSPTSPFEESMTDAPPVSPPTTTPPSSSEPSPGGSEPPVSPPSSSEPSPGGSEPPVSPPTEPPSQPPSDTPTTPPSSPSGRPPGSGVPSPPSIPPSSISPPPTEPPTKPPRLDYGDSDDSDEKQTRIPSKLFEDVFENPVVGAREALDFDPLED